MFEFIIYFVIYTAFYAVFEVFLLEQVWKNKVKLMSWQTYWYIHPIPLALAVYFLSNNVFITVASYFLYGVLQDYLYNKLAHALGSDVKYSDYLEMLGRFPKYYYINTFLGMASIFIGFLMSSF
jgi:hypothetical protein